MSEKEGPLFLRSRDNERLAFTVQANPPVAGSPVTLTEVPEENWDSSLSQWVLEPIGKDLFRLTLFASQGTMFLEAASDAVGAALQIGAASTDPTQQWRMEEESGEVTHGWLECNVPARLEVGFDGDLPLDGMPLAMQAAHDSHDRGDQFLVQEVW